MWGGFPLVCKENDENSKMVVLTNVFDSVVLKDIVLRNKVASPVVLEKILEYLIANSSTTISGNGIAAALSDSGQSVSAPLVYDYLRFIADACVCDKVSRYDIRGKKILTKLDKYYLTDMGLGRIRNSGFKLEMGALLENVIYNELLMRGYEVYVGKTRNGEIDFVAIKDNQKEYYQVAYYLYDDNVIEREFGAYKNVGDNYPKYVISFDKMDFSRDGIIHKNVLQFLLDL